MVSVQERQVLAAAVLLLSGGVGDMNLTQPVPLASIGPGRA